jgi:hypothetical protein
MSAAAQVMSDQIACFKLLELALIVAVRAPGEA